MKTLLFELGCEEIPARFIDTLCSELSQAIQANLKTAKLLSEDVTVDTFATYRRLSVRVSGVLSSQIEEEDKLVLGPPQVAAQTPDGEWTPAAIGWAKKNEADLSTLEFKEDAKGRLCCAVLKKAPVPQSAQSVLPSIIQQSFSALKLPIAMRWGAETVPFVRTVQWILCLLDHEVVPVTLYDETSSNISYGHRFLSQAVTSDGAQVNIQTPADYESVLEQANVIVDTAQRRRIIEDFVSTHNGGEPISIPLLNEVQYLVEQPVPMMGQFHDRFLALPSSVLIECMAKHQKYFPVFKDGKLTNQFIVIADNVTESNASIILRGNEKVLSARLEDAMFFWNEDLKHPLSYHRDRLKAVLYQDGLGSIYEKTDRLATVMTHLASLLSQDQSLFAAAGNYSKADLTTQMVFEFASLQGEAGYHYATHEGLSPDLSSALAEQYYPLSETSQLPSSLIGACLALADRLDLIVACFENGNIPTSSKDPWGIRKSMIAINRILLSVEAFKDLDIYQLLELTYQSYGERFQVKENLSKIIEFYKPRLKHVFANTQKFEHEVSLDMIDACLAKHIKPQLLAYTLSDLAKLKSINSVAYKCLVDTAVRVGRLADPSVSGDVKNSLFESDLESVVLSLYSSPQSSPSIPYFVELATVLETYFEKVLVNVDNHEIKHNRLLMMNQIHTQFSTLFDAELLVV